MGLICQRLHERTRNLGHVQSGKRSSTQGKCCIAQSELAGICVMGQVTLPHKSLDNPGHRGPGQTATLRQVIVAQEVLAGTKACQHVQTTCQRRDEMPVLWRFHSYA